MKTFAQTLTTNRIRYTAVAAVLLLATVSQALFVQHADAASLTKLMVRFDRMQISTPTTGTICAQPASVATEASVQVTYPTGYTLGTAANFAVNATNLSWPTGGTAWPGIATATNVTGQVVSFPSGDLTVGTLYCFNWTNSAAVSVKSAATSSNIGSISTLTAGSVAIDTESYATASISNDQIIVSATVPSIFSFALSANSDALGTLAIGAVTSSPTPRTATVSTNASNGWTVWAKDANSGLTSASASSTIPTTTPGTNSTLTAGINGYNTGVSAAGQAGGSGTVSVAAPFIGTGAGQGGGLDATLRPLATSTGTADTSVISLKNNVTISPIQAAASDYTDTITVVGAGLF